MQQESALRDGKRTQKVMSECLAERVNGPRKAGHLTGGVFPVHRFTRVLIKYGVGAHQSGSGGLFIVVLNGETHGFHHVFDTGTGGTVAGGLFQTLLMALYSRLVVSQGILQKTRS